MVFSAPSSLAAGALLLLTLAGCNGSSDSQISAPSPAASASPQSPVTSSPQVSATPSPSPSPETSLISAQGIGAARLGMTYGDLKRTLGADAELAVKSPFIADFDAVAIRQAGEVQYYILYLSGQTLSDSDPIQGILTDNPKFRTAENIGTKTPISEAEQVYGQATLSYNTQNESREYARFAKQPPALSFGTGNGNASPAGIYATPQASYNETQQFREDAVIQSVLVVCLTEDCSSESPNP
ncbi:MAG: hypothetical protein KME07_10475 [Pegethrix bostrychoides GSE-TBD4-15B]|uniref:Uncharacterized protein n=1 Tax=Pegethrix bostrychoides GSE-TBD4-15B TaxID=2839662 RepID=A0A951PA77_9CYAN|nr:hypothetical protein [Pegethrix bostrychoides GSE-TBD4-15B]